MWLVVLILLAPAVRLANSSIVAGASLAVVFSALYLLLARSKSPLGMPSFRAQGIIGLLMVSLICALPGLFLINYSGYLNKSLLRYGILATFGGMILGAILFTVLANRFVKDEKKHLQEDFERKWTRTSLLQRKIKARASVLRMKGRPFFVVGFCLVGWLVGIAMVMTGLTGDRRVGMFLLGLFISLAYTCALGLVCILILRGKWDSYFDAAIEKIDLQIKHPEEKAASLTE
jgi:hypothetical protein